MRTSRIALIASCGVAAMLAGCTINPPVTVVPASPTVATYPATVVPAAPATVVVPTR